ncbi:DUF7010 family protein [Pseudohongiella sp.]|uniref:Uncharacterized protein n=1 Tax=marine sediment metagenome TaxID=412755 RepID=A0A0F9W0V0_9ZZZZ|nr:hypothetical protein [Pseudohongiella sp.]
MDSISAAQCNMRDAYYGGAPGIVSSGSAWLLAAIVAALVSERAGVITLVLAGMFIFPVSVVLCRLIGCTGKHSKDNPLAPLAMEGTIWMLLSIPIAIAAAMFRVEWFFPAMLLVIAGRYLTFSTLYGMRIFWIFGATLVASGLWLIYLQAPVFLGALTGALVEYIFGVVIFVTYKASQTKQALNSQGASAGTPRDGAC